MRRRRKTVVLLVVVFLLSIAWLFVGVYRDREWGEMNLFIKYRPSLKVFFHAPLGEADPSDVPGHEGYLTAEQQREEDAYVEFVERHQAP